MADQTSQGFKKLDIQIQSSLSEALQIELFGADNPQVEVYKPNVNEYHPLSCSGAPVLIPLSAATATTGLSWALAFIVGGYDVFTDDSSPYGPDSSKSFVFYDENGNLVYQPGYKAGSVQTGKVVVSSTATNYRHLMKVCEKAAFTINILRIKVSMSYLGQLQNNFRYNQTNVINEGVNSTFSADTYESEAQQQPNIVTMPVNQVITPKSSILYKMNGTSQIGDGTTPDNTVAISLFFTPKTASMLSLL